MVFIAYFVFFLWFSNKPYVTRYRYGIRLLLHPRADWFILNVVFFVNLFSKNSQPTNIRRIPQFHQVFIGNFYWIRFWKLLLEKKIRNERTNRTKKNIFFKIVILKTEENNVFCLCEICLYLRYSRILKI